MNWTALLAAFLVCHVAGDLLLQTEWQAITKLRGLSDLQGRRALLAHASTYTLAYLPALIWVGTERGVLRAVLVALLVWIPHITIDDGRFVRLWLRRVKHAPEPAFSLSLMVDQSFHVVFLFAAAVIGAL
jgi:hypothetical protein